VGGPQRQCGILENRKDLFALPGMKPKKCIHYDCVSISTLSLLIGTSCANLKNEMVHSYHKPHEDHTLTIYH
jgi:hypothetical protein